MADITLRTGRDKSVRRQHPWVFSGAIERVDGQPAPGATVRLLTAAQEFLAYAAWSPASQIRCRIWTFDEAAFIDTGFIRERIARAIDMRRRLGLLDAGGACRLVFSESDGLPGLIADRFGDFVVCQLLSAGAEHWRDAIFAAIDELLSPRAIYERSDAAVRRKEGLDARRGLVRGTAAQGPIEFTSAGVRQLVDLDQGQKTGGYLDQSLNRGRVSTYAGGARVLDAYCYSGGFSIAALRAGAAASMLIDSSADALALAERQATLNAVAEHCEFRKADVPAELRRLRDAGRTFDLVILDPPKFVGSAQQLKSGCRAYKDINMLGLQLLNPGGILATFSCSGHVSAELLQKIVAGAAVDVRRDAQIIERLSQAPDHPVALQFPESEYLKGLILRVAG